MSLKELKNLAPWTWDPQATKHPPKRAALQDFEKVCQESKFFTRGAVRSSLSRSLGDFFGWENHRTAELPLEQRVWIYLRAKKMMVASCEYMYSTLM